VDQAIERAVRFISDTLKDEPSIDRLYLVEMAGRRFDLTPIQTEHLIAKYVYTEPQPR
jgi:hypothetical protein